MNGHQKARRIHEYSDALRELEQAGDSTLSDPLLEGRSGYVEARAGKPELAGEIQKRLLDRSQLELEYPPAYGLALISIGRCDNGPGLTSRDFLSWCEGRKIQLIRIQPGRPMQNGHVDSFNGRLRDECLNANWFRNLLESRAEITAWRDET
jgi:hypothetical protein